MSLPVARQTPVNCDTGVSGPWRARSCNCSIERVTLSAVRWNFLPASVRYDVKLRPLRQFEIAGLLVGDLVVAITNRRRCQLTWAAGYAPHCAARQSLHRRQQARMPLHRGIGQPVRLVGRYVKGGLFSPRSRRPHACAIVPSVGPPRRRTGEALRRSGVRQGQDAEPTGSLAVPTHMGAALPPPRADDTRSGNSAALASHSRQRCPRRPTATVVPEP